MKNRSLLVIAVTLPLLGATFAHGTLITFDDIPAGLIADQYLSRGVRFYVGNGQFGTATGLLMAGGLPVSAYAGNFATSISQPNIMNPGPGLAGNSDIFVQFFDSAGNRTLASSVGIFNDTDGHPSTIFIEGFDASGLSLGRTQINGGGAGGTFSNPGISFAKIYPSSGQVGNIGVDNFSFALVPAPASGVLWAAGLGFASRRRRRA